ncbi:MAG: CPBP family intramembrane metalloprotease [Candidatus Omnitrophica bacterium]|nr:CPBP family intramembrane metalloprotease [Candidatus Omnitrophota bacterium]MCM8777357.1 CPBP family intramembrane metalloprotease [Candidatus Omnitrophota bacterium]
MKKLKLSGSDILPDFSVATGITFFIITFSLIISFLTMRFSPLHSDTLLMSIWGIFSSFILTVILLWFILIRYRIYVVQLLSHPFNYFIKGLHYYLFFLPILFLVTIPSFYIFKKIGFVPEPQQIMSLYLQTNSFYLLFIIFFLSCIVAPFSEELIFRGIIYAGFKKSFSVPLSMILSSLIFALLHNEIFVLAGLFAFGIFLSYLFEKYKNLWLSISVHFFNNLFTTIIVLIVKYFYNIEQ